MLKFLRKKTKMIIWAVIVAFVSWGGYAVSLQFEQSNRSPGRIFGKEVSFREHLLAYHAVQIFSHPKSEEPPKPEELEAQAWEFLILSYEARHRKIQVTDEEVREEIAQLLGRQEGFPATDDQYLQWIRATFHEEPREFENQLREHLRIRKLLEQVRKGMTGNPEQATRQWLLELYSRAKPQIYNTRS